MRVAVHVRLAEMVVVDTDRPPFALLASEQDHRVADDLALLCDQLADDLGIVREQVSEVRPGIVAASLAPEQALTAAQTVSVSPAWLSPIWPNGYALPARALAQHLWAKEIPLTD